MNTKLEYTIIFQPRSGSTLLTHFLSETGVLGFPKETFSDYWVKTIRKKFGINIDNDPMTYIEKMKKQSTTPNGVFGHKISLYQIEKYLNNKFPNYFSNKHIFYITRKSKVYQAVSDYIASETNEWAKIRGIKPKQFPGSVEYNAKKLRAKFLYHCNNELNLRNFINQNDMVLKRTIYYEDLCSDPNLILRRISEDLSIEYRGEKVFTLDNAKYQKQRNSLNDSFAKYFFLDEFELIKKSYEKLKLIDFPTTPFNEGVKLTV
jgi:LPS sulfotransferase NodH